MGVADTPLERPKSKREKQYHRWERRLMGDGHYSMVEVDVTEYVEALLRVAEAARRDFEDRFVDAWTFPDDQLTDIEAELRAALRDLEGGVPGQGERLTSEQRFGTDEMGTVRGDTKEDG